MDNTTHNLYAESLSAKVNRLEHTIRELTQLIQQRQNKITHLESINESIKTESKRRTDIIINLTDQVNYWRDLAGYDSKSIKFK